MGQCSIYQQEIPNVIRPHCLGSLKKHHDSAENLLIKHAWGRKKHLPSVKTRSLGVSRHDGSAAQFDSANSARPISELNVYKLAFGSNRAKIIPERSVSQLLN
jgi:hypothetical protein